MTIDLLFPLFLTALCCLGLLFGAKRLVVGTSALGYLFGIPQALIGLTILALSVALPEMYFGIQHDVPTTSNVANLSLVLGMACLIQPFIIQNPLLKKATMILIAGVAVMLAMTLDRNLNHNESLILLCLVIGLIVWVIGRTLQLAAKHNQKPMQSEIPTDLPIWQALVSILIGIFFVFICAYALQNLSINLVPEIQIVSQCLPELAIAIIAARKLKPDLLIGMLIGSNCLNLLLTVPLAALEKPLLNLGTESMLMMVYQLLLTAFLLVMIHFQFKMSRIHAAVLIGSFVTVSLLTL